MKIRKGELPLPKSKKPFQGRFEMDNYSLGWIGPNKKRYS